MRVCGGSHSLTQSVVDWLGLVWGGRGVRGWWIDGKQDYVSKARDWPRQRVEGGRVLTTHTYSSEASRLGGWAFSHASGARMGKKEGDCGIAEVAGEGGFGDGERAG
jgi:hypothetical protein